MADEQSEVERLTEEVAAKKFDLAAATELERQRENLLPKLEKRRDWLDGKLRPLNAERNRITEAMGEIKSGTPTDLKLRKPRKPRSAEGA